MGLSVSTSTNHHDNSIRQQNTQADNQLSIGGNIGGGNTQTSSGTTDGNLGLSLPSMGLMALVDLDTAAELVLRRREIADDAKNAYQSASNDANHLYRSTMDQGRQFG